jgi:purine-nucleoside phosphorylase
MMERRRYFHQIEEAVNKLMKLAPAGFRPRAVISLGTGLDSVSNNLHRVIELSYQDLGDFPISMADGCPNMIYLCYFKELPVVTLSGRWHLYEGYDPKQITLPVRVMAQWGASVFIFANAAGGLNPAMRPGDVMLITDHINLTGKTPLAGANEKAWGPRFPDMSQAYDRDLLQTARKAAENAGITYFQGVYASMHGPQLETPAETRMLQLLGAQAVGMSTVLEVIAAIHHGAKVFAISAITNVNNPDAMQAVSLPDIINGAALAAPDIQKIIAGVLNSLKY